MASFLVAIDPDPPRRDTFFSDATERIAPLKGLVRGECSSGVFRALWATGPRAPITFESDERGAAIVWGDALNEEGIRFDAGRMRSAWSASETSGPVFDGYHAAVVFDADRGLTIGADLIGMFPVYWWASGAVLLAGSSPELFRLHPCFRSTVDLEGLAGILLTMHSVDGRTLLEGVRRLAPGHFLRADGRRAPREVERYRLPLSDSYHDIPFSAQVELLHEVLVDATRRHAPRSLPHALSLSGGRDSRLVAGLLERQGSHVTAVTFGERDDMEMRCARRVARVAGFAHRTLPLEVDHQGKCGEQQATWFHCTTGFGALANWDSPARMRELPARIATGYVMDPVIGGTHMTWAYDRADRRMSFDAFYARINARGVAEETLRLLLSAKIARDVVDSVKSTIRRTYESYSDVESRRAWCYDIHHRQRLHVGNVPWYFSFAAWPVQPVLDRRVLAVAGGLPFSTLAERRAQDEVIRRFYPQLAELPLDRNSYDTEPLSPRVRYLVGRYLADRVAPITKAATRLGRRENRELRFYYRLYDFNGPGWRAIRRLAEPHREKLGGLVDRARLDEYLPPPEADLPVRNGIVEPSGRKLLVGLILWARDHL
ncbi:MAG TPA: asparagine synthase-related protein [Gemmatimonadaceae bacterium]|jgi:asparagine synthase (glutamine-hydrolysing)|nr:asparagine synthase-related protein [Gemmatimonadaceae bacterium]